MDFRQQYNGFFEHNIIRFHNTIQWDKILCARKSINLREGSLWSIRAPKVVYNEEVSRSISDADEAPKSSMGENGDRGPRQKPRHSKNPICT